MDRKNIFFVIDETCFYQPHFLAKFLRQTPDRVVGAALVIGVPDRNNLERYLRRHWYFLKFREIARLVFLQYRAKILDAWKRNWNGKYHSVRSVLEDFGIDYFTVRDSINREEYLEKIRSRDVDIIVSSNPLYFGNEILALPKLCCLNRHSALLPAYGGLWPVFQAYRCGEKFAGVSVHLMVSGIDKGDVLSYRKVPIVEGQPLGAIYDKCFDLSSDALLEAIEKVKAHNLTPCPENASPSYFSFPTAQHWADFRKRNGKFI